MRGHADALVVGGGLAGSSVAARLAKAGRHVVLLEKSKGPHHKVCGEFISREALHYLEQHNVDVSALGSVPIRSVRLVTNKRQEEAGLPFAAISVTRKVLDEAMLRMASQAGVEIHCNSAVDELRKTSQGDWIANLRDGRSSQAAHAFLATGKHDLRGWARPAGTHRGLVAFKMFYQLTPEQHAQLGHAVELTLFTGGYAGMQPVEHGAVNLCLVVTSEQLRKVGSNWSGLLPHLLQSSPHLDARLSGATPLLTAPLAISHIPYGHMQRPVQDGLWRVGDQAAVIPSFCGDGMAIALHSGALAAEHFLHAATPESFQHKLRGQLQVRLSIATRISQLLVTFPQAARVISLSPGLLSSIALMTRIPESALLTSNGVST